MEFDGDEIPTKIFEKYENKESIVEKKQKLQNPSVSIGLSSINLKPAHSSMERKRKLESESNETSEPPQKHQQCQKQGLDIRNDDIQEHSDEAVEVYKNEIKDDDADDNDTNECNTAGDRTVVAATSSGFGNGGDEDDEEPIEDLLESFSKEQLLILLKEVAKKHRDVANRIRAVADEDPVHRKIFVHGLGWDTKANTLIEAFKQYGEIEDCKSVVDKVSGQSKGYGFILFKSRSGARNALKQPQKKIGTRMTACQLASIGPVQGNPVVAPAQRFNPRKIYVSNVSADLDPQKLLEFFSRFGEIEEGPLGLDKATGRPKGFTLFVYRSPESAKKALEEPHKTFEGHVLHCHKASDGPKPAKQHQNHHNSNNQNSRYQRSDNTGYGAPGGHGHLIAGNNQAVQALNPAIGQALNPAIGQALTALLASQGAGLGLNQAFGQALVGTLGTASPGAAAGMPSGYGPQANITPVVFPGYSAQVGYQAGYQTQQPGQGGAGRGQHGVGYGGPYMGQ